jgi:hypothetical protein
MKSIIKANGDVDGSLLEMLLYPIRWMPGPEGARQYYHIISLEAMNFLEVCDYARQRCERARVIFPQSSHKDFEKLASQIENTIPCENLPAGKMIVLNGQG